MLPHHHRRHRQGVRQTGDPDPRGQRPGGDEERAADHERPPDEEDAELAQAPVLHLDRLGGVEEADEQSGGGECEDDRAAHVRQIEGDEGVDRRQADESRRQAALRRQPAQDRMGCVKGAGIVLRVQAFLKIEEIVREVVGGMGDDQANQRQDERQPVDPLRGNSGDAPRGDGQQTADHPRRERHLEDAGPHQHEPARDEIHPLVGGQIARINDFFPIADQLPRAARPDYRL